MKNNTFKPYGYTVHGERNFKMRQVEPIYLTESVEVVSVCPHFKTIKIDIEDVAHLAGRSAQRVHQKKIADAVELGEEYKKNPNDEALKARCVSAVREMLIAELIKTCVCHFELNSSPIWQGWLKKACFALLFWVLGSLTAFVYTWYLTV